MIINILIQEIIGYKQFMEVIIMDQVERLEIHAYALMLVIVLLWDLMIVGMTPLIIMVKLGGIFHLQQSHCWRYSE